MAFIWLPVLFGAIYVLGLLAFVWGDARNRRQSQRLAGITELLPITPPPRVSVIVPARNEEHDIRACLSSILACDWPQERLHVIVVDDHSTDGTASVVRAVDDDRIELVDMALIPGGELRRGHKKRAVAEGFRRADGDMILLTDADTVVPPDWIRLMVAHLGEGVGCVAGPIVYDMAEPSSGGARAFMARVLSGIGALEYAGLQGIASGAVGLGRPILSFGASSGYRKGVFEEVGKFDGLQGVSSGDDALLMQRIAYGSRWSVRYCAHPGAIVRTRPPGTFRAFWQQRRRWSSGTTHYAAGAVAYSLAIYLFLVSLPVYAVAAFVWPMFWWPLGVGVTMKLVGEGIMLFRMGRFYGLVRFWPLYIPAQPFHVALCILAVLFGLSRPIHWKNRELDR